MNGQIPHVATSLDINNGQEGQSNLLLEDNTSNINWRDELSVADRTQFITQLSLALKRLSPNTSDTETRGVASSFEAGLYQRCNSKNEYIMAHAKKFQQIKDQIASNSQQVNFLQQPAFNSNQPFGSQSFVYNRPRPVLSQQQFQFYFARQMALQQQQQQQQYLQQQYSPNIASYEPLVSTPSLTPSSTASSSVNTIVTNGMNRLDQQQMYAFNPNLMRPVQQQGMINSEFMMQNRPFPQKQQPDVMLQRPPMKYPAATGVTPTKMSPAAIVKQLDETVRKTKVTGAFIESLSGQDKAVIREQIQQMKAMYDKLDHLLPIFLSRTGNYEATRRIILMKHMLEDQVNLLPQDKYIINLDNVYKLREQLNGYFTWIRNTMGMGHPLQMQQQQQQQHNQQQQQQQQQYIQQLTQQQLTQQQLTQHQLSQQQLTQQQLTQQQLLQSHLLLQQQQLQLLSQSQLMQPHLAQSQLPQPPQLPQEQPQTQPQQQQHHQMLQQLMDDKLIQSSQPQSQQPSSLPPSYMGQQQINNSSNTMVPMPETSVAPSTSPMTMKRNSIDLKLPPSKKQRGAKSSTSSPVMNRKNDSAPSLVQSQLPNSQNQMQQQQQHQQQQPIIPTGIPVKEGMPLNQHEMQLQAFYMAAVEAGIPKDIINLLPPKALQRNWLLQQAAQGRIPLLPQQQQQIQYTLDAYIDNAKATLNMKKEAIPSSNTDTSTATTLVNDSLDAKQLGSYLKEGYKDETFGTPDLGNLTELTSVMKQQDEAATTAINPTDEDNFHTWVETDLDIGLDWDANEFVKFDDNESEKLIDDSGKLCAV